jgi:uncharacterized protein YneF (UPF0154 family)
LELKYKLEGKILKNKPQMNADLLPVVMNQIGQAVFP